jgi:hypothetical protein
LGFTNQRFGDSSCSPGQQAGGHGETAVEDLRERVLATVAEGVSGRQAAERFEGDRKSHRIDAQQATILALLKATPDITIEELRHSLSKEGPFLRLWHDQPLLRAPQDHAKKRSPCLGAGSPGCLDAAGGLA